MNKHCSTLLKSQGKLTISAKLIHISWKKDQKDALTSNKFMKGPVKDSMQRQAESISNSTTRTVLQMYARTCN